VGPNAVEQISDSALQLGVLLSYLLTMLSTKMSQELSRLLSFIVMQTSLKFGCLAFHMKFEMAKLHSVAFHGTLNTASMYTALITCLFINLIL